MTTLDPWEKFLRDVETTRRKLLDRRKDLDENREIWYRGHGKTGWSLLSQLYRKDIVPEDQREEKERRAFEEFEQAATRLFRKSESDWDVLFDMQHYSIPTRLLDWSETLGTAVAFALHSKESGGRGEIWLLDPLALNKESGISKIRRFPRDAESFGYKAAYWDKEPLQYPRPVAVHPPWRSDRLFAQKGTFTIQGELPEGLEKVCRRCVESVVLPRQALEGARRFLRDANLNQYSLYPDIEGMALYIKGRVFGTKTARLRTKK